MMTPMALDGLNLTRHHRQEFELIAQAFARRGHAAFIDPNLVEGGFLSTARQYRDEFRTIALAFAENFNKGASGGGINSENFHEYQKDIDHLFVTIAQQYTDMSCVHLHTDELIGQAYLKFSILFSRGYFTACPTRKDFFARLKTTINNHIKGLVQRYRFTIKRTGIRPPPKGQVPTDSAQFRSTKPVEISLDDPDSMVQINEPMSMSMPGDSDQERLDEFRALLMPAEQLVWDQFCSPNYHSMIVNDIELDRGRWPGDKEVLRVNIKKHHLAEGIGLGIEVFNALEQEIARKYKLFDAMDKDPEQHQAETEFNAALTILCDAFGLQIPRSMNRIIVRRAVTLAARRNFDKLTPELNTALVKVGAKLPVSNGLSLNCFGVLFEASNKICNICGKREACRVEASSIGLDKVVPHPTVLGVKQMRIPTLTVDAPPQLPVPNDRNDGIHSYLNETFNQSLINRDTYYRHREWESGRRPPQIFCVITSVPSEHIQLRFCKPHSSIRPALDKRRNGWYLPDGVEVDEAIELIERHSSNILNGLEEDEVTA
jgi:hypothetical protein